MRELIATLTVLAGLSLAPRSNQVWAPVGFSIVLETTPNGWAAHCDSGCRWREASFACPGPCGAIIDANGLVTTISPRPEPTPFSFRVEHLGNGARAESRNGTLWKTLSWDCPTAPCRVRVDGAGVSPDLRTR